MYLTPSQRKALWVLMGLVWLSCAIRWINIWQTHNSDLANARWERLFRERADSLSLQVSEPIAEISPGTTPSAPGPAAPTSSQVFPIRINQATAAQLTALPGIGPSRARAIVAYRRENGPFTSLEQLLRIRGIGRKTLDTLRDKIVVESSASPTQ